MRVNVTAESADRHVAQFVGPRCVRRRPWDVYVTPITRICLIMSPIDFFASKNANRFAIEVPLRKMGDRTLNLLIRVLGIPAREIRNQASLTLL
jgi:hypothetical protein